MSEKFLKELKIRAAHTLVIKDNGAILYSEEWAGINAVINTLEEMMIGEPVRAVMVHEIVGPMEFTSIFEADCEDYDEEEPMAVFEGLHGTHGGKATVVVFGDPEKTEDPLCDK